MRDSEPLGLRPVLQPWLFVVTPVLIPVDTPVYMVDIPVDIPVDMVDIPVDTPVDVLVAVPWKIWIQILETYLKTNFNKKPMIS